MSEYTQIRRTSSYGPRTALLLKTGQTTKYHDGDDGDLQLGVEPSYDVLTAGQYSGTVNITINAKTATLSNECVRDKRTGKMFARYVVQSNIGPAADGKLFWEQWTLGPKTDISFDAATKKIHSVAGDFDTGACCIGRKITVSGAAQAGNNQDVTVAAITANDITVNETLVNEAAGASVSLATVDDLVWNLVDQANANGLGGYNDWRLPNRRELESIVDLGHCNPAMDATVFPSTPNTYHWSASTHPCGSAYAWSVHFDGGYVTHSNKRSYKFYVRLARG